MENSRRFRGIFGIATTWGIALSTLATASLALGLATGLVPPSIFGARELVAVAVRGLLVGGVAGGLFAWLLAHRERGHSLATLSTRRVALWGFVAAGSLPAILALAAAGPVLPLGVLVAGTAGFGAIGSLLSTATLRMARRAEARLDGTDEGLSRLTP
jgi:hypothetical protein